MLEYLVTGTFNTIALYLLAFDTVTKSLTVVNKLDANGPHQYLGINKQRDHIYTTTWAPNPTLASWAIDPPVNDTSHPSIRFVNQVDITATSSYIFVTDEAIYSAGGPTGEVHLIDSKTGGFGEQVQKLLYVPEEKLESEDKTRKALRYGSHGIDISSKGHAFVPHLGHNSIFMYSVKGDSTLEFITEAPSPKEHDGPRHNVPSPDGNYLYTVTEHSSDVNVYQVLPSGLQWIQGLSIIPPDDDPAKYRGDTIRLSNNGDFVFATTRGGKQDVKGWLTVWARDANTGKLEPTPLDRYVTPTSGGKANAIEILPFRDNIEQDQDLSTIDRIEKMVLTDDEQGYIFILEWDGVAIREAARVQLPDDSLASHAVWLA